MIQWKEIPGFSKYEASNKGKIRNKKTKQILKSSKRESGYEEISIYNDDNVKKSKKVHTFIALTFIPNLTIKKQ